MIENDDTPIPMAANGVKEYCVNKGPFSSVNSWEFEREKEDKFEAKDSPTELSICVNPNTQNIRGSSEHEKHIASVNARACVGVLMESTRHPSKLKPAVSPAVTPPKANGDTRKVSSVPTVVVLELGAALFPCLTN